MSNSIRTIYLYIVALIALGMIVSGTITLAYNFSSFLFPEVSGYYGYDEDTDYLYNEKYISSVKESKNTSLRNAISSIAVVGLGVPLYVYHWNKAKNS